MERPAIEPVQDLCTYVRQQMTIRDMFRKEDYLEDGFNEVSETVSDNLIKHCLTHRNTRSNGEADK